MSTKKRQIQESETQRPPEDEAEYREPYPVLGEEPEDFEPCNGYRPRTAGLAGENGGFGE